MNNWLNHQNKHHFGLFRSEILLNKNADWLNHYGFRLHKSDALNKKISRISPRRGKMVTKYLASAESQPESSGDIQDFLEAMEEYHELT